MNIVHGGGGAVGERLVRHPDVPVISLTGSRETGVKVLEAAAEGLKHVHLELGGKNAIIVMDDADLDLALEGILWSAFGTSGQRCTATSRVIVHESLYDTLAARLVERAEALRLGPGWEDDSDVGPVINAAALEKIHSYTQIGRDDGATLLTGGEIADEGDLAKGFYYRPTIFGDVEPDMRIAQEEIFGPTLSLIRFRDEADAFRISNGIRVRALVLDLHARREPRLPRDARPRGRDHLRQRRHDRRRGAPPVRRHEGDRQRPSRGRPGRARRVHGVEVGLRRLLRDAPARADRQHGVSRVKLVWFVPEEALDATRDAVFEAGGGRIGDYTHCSWYAAGTGTFFGGEDASPALGESGREERVAELRVETVVPGGPHPRRDRRAAARAPVRGAGVRRLPAPRPVKAKLFTDGGSRGNPGPAAYAFVLEAEDGTVLDARGRGDRCRDEQRRRVRGARRGPRARGRGSASTSSRSSPTRSSS